MGAGGRAGARLSYRPRKRPTDPLKLVGVGRSDLGISYEQELFLAAAKKLPVVAVAAVVPQPLNSLMAIEPSIRSVRDHPRAESTPVCWNPAPLRSILK